MSDYLKCWICNNWTRRDLVDSLSLEGSEVPVCLACVEALRSRDMNLEAKRKGATGATAPSSGRTLQDQLTAGRTGHATDDSDSAPKGPEPERVGSGTDPSAGKSARKDECQTAGCEKIALYSQVYLVEGEPMARTYRRCPEHQLYTLDLPSGRIIRVQATM
jgi:hypothetical protein